MPRIHQLDTNLINKIAAGEVIERPSSVVKELLENSIDAGARRIDVSVQQGGLESIRVVDDGVGMDPDDLPLAIASHATSKIQTAEDLFQVTTKGFRGEALASIAEISHMRIRSRTRDATAGAELFVAGGASQPIRPCSSAVGTSMEVRNLFFNTPVRRKFLRTTQTEMGHICEAVTRIALAHENVHFTVAHNDRTLFELPATDTWESRIAILCGEDVAARLIPVDRQEDGMRIHGFVAGTQISRSNNRSQYFFLNRRHIRDRTLSHALGEAYRGLLMTGRMPIAFLHLEIPPELVDVNVHPTKLEVRFVDSSKIYSLLLGMLRSKFLTADFATHGDPSKAIASDESRRSATTPLKDEASANDEVRASINSLWGRQSSTMESSVLRRSEDADRIDDRAGYRPLPDCPPVPPFPGIADPAPSGEPAPIEAARRTPDQPSSPTTTSLGTPAMQVCNRYLITETDDGVAVIDQHALHERILYEELRRKLAEGTLERQRLLVPEPVDLPPAEAGALLENREFLLELGMEIEPFGGHTILVLSYPAILANMSPADIVRKVAEHLTDSAARADRRSLLDEVLHTIACKAAIKAGDRLTQQEVRSLLDRRHLVHDAHHCPHGRPTTLIFTRDQLDRQFKRT
jgi:DNA mismatch repair protein MutL